MGGGDLAAPDGEYASTLLMEAETESDLPKEGEVIGSYENMYLVGFNTETEASDFAGASENMAFSIASGPNIAGGEVFCEGNAFGNLESELANTPKQRSKGYTIALIDTGAPEGMEGVSMLGDDGTDQNGHATKMVSAMRLACPDAKILPIKALDDNGRGDAASIYAAIQYAIAQDVDVLNLSFYGKASEGNAAVEQAIKDATDKGIAVVGAAGNDGSDAKGYIPGGIGPVLVLGACDSEGKRLASSNYGDTVDYYMESGSTSEAAAMFSGYLALYEGNLGNAMAHTHSLSGAWAGNVAGAAIGDGFKAAINYELIESEVGIKEITECEWFDYFLYERNISKDNCTIVNKKSGSHWKIGDMNVSTDDNTSPEKMRMVYCDKSFPATSTSSTTGVKLASPDDTLTLRMKNAVLGHNGVFYDLDLTFDNITFQYENSKTSMMLMRVKDSSLGTFYSTNSWADKDTGLCGSKFDVTYTVTSNGTAVSHWNSNGQPATLVLAWNDIDQPYKPERSYISGKFPAESITLMSGFYLRDRGDTDKYATAYLGENNVLNSQDLGNGHHKYTGTCPTGSGNDVDSNDAGLAITGQATGTKIRWTGSNCGTAAGLVWDFFITAKTRVRWMDKNGDYGDWSEVDNRVMFMDDYEGYEYTWNATGNKNNLTIYTKVTETVTDQTARDNVTKSINVPRKQYTYTFHGNKPSGASKNVTNVPDAITKYAENTPGSVGNPKLKGYKFKGWYNTSASTGGTAYNASESMLSNKNFYARWEPQKYYVAYDPNGATNFNHETGEFVQNVTAGTMAKSTFYTDTAGTLRANAFTREGFTFAGWNTKADGTGTAYPDGYSNVLNWTDEDEATITLYAQWTKKLGTETLTVVSEETGNPVPGVTLQLYKSVNGTWAYTGTQLTTNALGQVSVQDMRWYNYEWRMTNVPAGYVKSANTGFMIRWDTLSARNTVILYMKHVQIILDSRVSEVIKGENAPAFFYHVSGRDAAGVQHDYDVMVQVDKNTLTGTNKVPDLFAGTYTITQTPVSRYNAQNAQNVSHATANGINATVDVLNHDSAEVLFPYTIQQMGGFGSMGSQTNRLRK